MKYIRTKDGVYEVTNWNEDGSCWCLNNGGAYFRKEDIIAQADTIEELCDCFIELVPKYNGNEVDGFYHNFWYYEKEEKTFYNLEDCQILYLENFDADFRGAIWTDKGLIYVAKMNEKGELELI